MRPAAKKADNRQQEWLRSDLHSLVDEILDAYPVVQSQTKMGSDGFGSTSLGAVGSGVTDPVGNLVTIGWEEHGECGGEGCEKCSDGFLYRPPFDPKQQAEDWLTQVDELRALAQSTANRGRKLLPSNPENPGAPGCRSCARTEGHNGPRFVEVHYKDRCRWCYDFNRVYKTDPPVELVEAHHAGKRITERMVLVSLRAG
jgi:hypothetical protein